MGRLGRCCTVGIKGDPVFSAKVYFIVYFTREKLRKNTGNFTPCGTLGTQILSILFVCHVVGHLGLAGDMSIFWLH